MTPSPPLLWSVPLWGHSWSRLLSEHTAHRFLGGPPAPRWCMPHRGGVCHRSLYQQTYFAVLCWTEELAGLRWVEWNWKTENWTGDRGKSQRAGTLLIPILASQVAMVASIPFKGRWEHGTAVQRGYVGKVWTAGVSVKRGCPFVSSLNAQLEWSCLQVVDLKLVEAELTEGRTEEGLDRQIVLHSRWKLPFLTEN